MMISRRMSSVWFWHHLAFGKFIRQLQERNLGYSTTQETYIKADIHQLEHWLIVPMDTNSWRLTSLISLILIMLSCVHEPVTIKEHPPRAKIGYSAIASPFIKSVMFGVSCLIATQPIKKKTPPWAMKNEYLWHAPYRSQQSFSNERTTFCFVHGILTVPGDCGVQSAPCISASVLS